MIPSTTRSATRPTRSQRMPRRARLLRGGLRVRAVRVAARLEAPWSPMASIRRSRDAGRLLPPQRALRPLVKGAATRVRGRVAELLLDPQKLVVLRHAVGARGRARLDLAAARGD